MWDWLWSGIATGKSEFVAALAGALVGGLITLAVQIATFLREDWLRRDDRAQRKEEERIRNNERDATAAFSILAKMSRAHTDIGNVRNHLLEGKKLVEERGGKVSNAIKPTLSDPIPFSFSLDELVLIRDLRQDQITNDALNLPYIHRMYIEAMSTFRSLRREMASLVSKVDRNADGSTSVVFEGNNGSIAALKDQEATDVIESLMGFCENDFKLANNLLVDTQAALLERLGKDSLRVTWDVKRIEG